MLQWRMDRERVVLYARFRGQISQLSKLGHEFWPAVGIARIIESVHSDEDVARPARFGESERQAQKDRVSRRHISDRDTLPDAVLWNCNVAGQRRSAECAQIQREQHMALGQLTSNGIRRLELDPVPLVVI